MRNQADILKEILNRRGIVEADEIAEFLSPKPTLTYDPSLLPDMDEGVDLILSEIEKGSKILVYGDYDADGITATSLMLSILRHLIPDSEAEERLGYYIPSRFVDGYGLNREAIKAAFEKGYNMVITVDCGSVSVDEVEYAKSLGMTVLITDHHTVSDERADCLLINPKRPDCKYPFKDLAGCGVAFKVAQRLQKKANLPSSVLTEVLDLVAIGTVGDIMPLIGENRTLVKFGLRVINLGKRPGLRKLILGAGLNIGNISSDNLGFIIVPHLNASGRIEDATQTVELMMADETDANSDAIVSDLLLKNKERRRLQDETYGRCVKIIEGQGPSNEIPEFILVNSEEAHEGIMGIVAGKLKEHYYRPAAVATGSGEEGVLKGSGRSIDGINLYGLLENHKELFEKFGGHKGACGFTIRTENFEALREGLISDVRALRDKEPKLFERKYDIDADLELGEANLGLAQEMAKLAPFGNSNPKPLFRIRSVYPTDVKFMGDDSQHVRFTARGDLGSGLQCVLFNSAKKYGDVLLKGEAFDIIGFLEYQVWQGKERVQFIISEIVNN